MTDPTLGAPPATSATPKFVDNGLHDGDGSDEAWEDWPPGEDEPRRQPGQRRTVQVVTVHFWQGCTMTNASCTW